MKITKFQRILCVIVSCVLAFSVLTLPASANTFTDNTSAFIGHVKSSFHDFRNGTIDLDQFITEVETYIGRYMGDIMEVSGFADLLRYLESIGVDIDESWDDFYFQHHGGGGSSGNRDEIMKGYGAVIFKEYVGSTVSDSVQDYYYYGDYGIIFSSSSGDWYKMYGDDILYDVFGSLSGNLSYSTHFSGSRQVGLSSDVDNGYRLHFYGDWRYEDGTAADDQTTVIPDDPAPGYDDPSITEDELIDFLEDLLNQLALEFPDLSTVEGILAALLAEMKSLDHDNDAAALSAIQSAIAQLSATNSSDSEKIISALNNMSSGGNFDFEKLKTTLNEWIGLNGDYSEISKLEIVKDKFNKKIGFVSSFADLCGKVVTAYTKTSPSVSFDISLYGESHTISFDWLEQYMPTFRIMLCAFIYISYAWHTFRKVPGYISGGGENQ